MRFSGLPYEDKGGFPGGSDVKDPACNAGNWGSVPGVPPGGGNGNLLQYSCLENPMDRGLQSMGLKSQTRLSY